jgi:DNA-binding SARP family transcriptional activator
MEIADKIHAEHHAILDDGMTILSVLAGCKRRLAQLLAGGSSRVTSPAPCIFLLGRFEITRGEQSLRASAWTRRKAATLLQRLAAERRILKEQAIELLWPEGDPLAAANNLYRTVHALRQTLDTELGAGAAGTIFTFHDGIFMLAEGVWVDVAAFESLAGSRERADLTAALRLYTGDFLPEDRYAEWTLIPRAALSRQHREVRLRLAAYARESREYSDAIALLTPLLARDLADELVHRELMELYALAGHRHEALRQYQTCVEALAAELDVPPDPQTTALYARIVSGELAAAPLSVQAGWTSPVPIVPERKHAPPLVGRQSELDLLLRRLPSASAEREQVLLLAGDSGVGKTRLALEALYTLASSGVTTLFSKAYEQEGQIPYHPFIEAFDRYLLEHGHRPGEHPIRHFQRLGVSDPQQEQWLLFQTTLTFLMNLAAQGPVVLLIDDLHAADEASLHLFHYLARQTRAAPVMLLATYRSDTGAQGTTPFAALLNALYHEHLSKTLNLAPLAKSAVASMLSFLLGGQISLSLLEAMFAITEGNPFFVEEITRMLLESGQVAEGAGQWQLKPGVELPVPSGLAGLLRERISRLGALVETALKAAVVVGRAFQFDLLRRLVPLSEGELLDALDVALANHLLEETADGYSFHHPLTRRALYDALSRERRMLLHTRTAEAIEAAYANRPEGLVPVVEALAFHYERSASRDRAIPYLLQAGMKAADVYAFEVAVRCFERALALMDELGAHDPAHRWELLKALGWWGFILGNTSQAVARLEQALTFLPTEGWQPPGRDQARLHQIAAVLLMNVGKMAEAEHHIQAAMVLIDEHEDADEYAYALYHFALFYWHRGEFQQALEAAQKSLAIAQHLNEPISLARAYEMLALVCHSLGEWRRGLNFEQQRARLTGPELDVTEAFDVHLCLWEYQLYGDHGYEEVKQTVQTTLTQAQRMGAARAVALCHCFEGALEFQSGHWASAETALRDSIQIFHQIGAAFGEALACQRLGALLTASGRIEEGAATLYEGLAAAERALLRAHCLTRLNASLVRNRLAASDLLAADQALAVGLTMSNRHGNCSTCYSLLLPAAISLRIAQGNLEEAWRFCLQLDQAAAKYASHTWVAMARQAHGELAEAQGNHEDALNDYANALSSFRSAGNEYETARCLTAIAAIHLSQSASSNAETARQAQEEARQIFERLGVV